MLSSIFNYNDKYKKNIYKNKYFSDKIKLNKPVIFDYKKLIKESNDKYVNKILEDVNNNKINNYIKKELNDKELQINKIEIYDINNNYISYFFYFFILSSLLIYKR